MQTSAKSIVDLFDVTQGVATILSAASPWSEFSRYFMFLTLKAGGCSKSSSGEMTITYLSSWTEDDQAITVTLGGYDSQTLKRSHDITVRGMNAELRLKEMLLDLFEKERSAVVAYDLNCGS